MIIFRNRVILFSSLFAFIQVLQSPFVVPAEAQEIVNQEQFTIAVPTTTELETIIPLFASVGEIESTREAITKRPALQIQAQSLVNNLCDDNLVEFFADFDAYLFEWVDIIYEHDALIVIEDASYRLAFLEKYYGGSDNAINVENLSEAQIIEEYTSLRDLLVAWFVIDTADLQIPTMEPPSVTTCYTSNTAISAFRHLNRNGKIITGERAFAFANYLNHLGPIDETSGITEDSLYRLISLFDIEVMSKYDSPTMLEHLQAAQFLLAEDRYQIPQDTLQMRVINKLIEDYN